MHRAADFIAGPVSNFRTDRMASFSRKKGALMHASKALEVKVKLHVVLYMRVVLACLSLGVILVFAKYLWGDLI